MNATLDVPLRGAGGALALSGVLLAISVPFHPTILGSQTVADVVLETSGWRAIHIALALAVVLGSFGAAGIVAAHRGSLGRLGNGVLVVTLVGSATTACVAFMEAFAFPAMARDAPRLLDLHGPILGSPWAVMAAPAAGFPVGFAALGVLAARAGAYPRAGLALAATALAFTVGEGLFVPVLGVGSTLALSAAQMWWGWLLWHATDAVAPTRRPGW